MNLKIYMLRPEFVEDAKTMHSGQLSEKYGGSRGAICEILHRFGLPVRRRGPERGRQPLSEKTGRNGELIRDYMARKATVDEIAKKYGITRQRVYQILELKKKSKEQSVSPPSCSA
jgi:hypothetical protein